MSAESATGEATVSASTGRIPSLDGLRAVSILFVLISHARLSMPPALAEQVWLWRFAANSQLGVRVFFVISGFLITTLLIGDEARHGAIRLGAFYRRRVLRIFPAFYAYIAIVYALAAARLVPAPATSDFVSASTFTWNYAHLWFPGNLEGRYLLGQIWTLSLEEQFYLLWPATLLLVGLLRGRFVAATIILVMPFVRVGSYFFWPSVRPFIGELLHTTADSLMFGALLALMRGHARFEAALAWLNRTPWPCAGAFLGAVVVSPLLRLRFAGAYDLSFGWTFECLCITTIIVYVTRRPERTLGRILNSAPLVTVGVLSYSLYMWSMIFFTGVNRTWTGRFPLNLLVCLTAATLSYVCIERPFLKLKGRGRIPRATA